MRKYKNVILAAILSLVFISCTDTVENDSGNSSEPSKENQQTEYTVHFCCNEIANWDEVYVYSWDDSGSNAEWPGIKMSVAESGIYKASVKHSNVIFTDGNGKQTVDLKTQNGYFTPTGTDSIGQVTGLWSATKPENGSGEEEKPTKLETPIVTAMYDKSSKRIILVWPIVQDADSYEIYYNTTNNFNEEKTFEDTTETSYTTTEIKTNKITYYFWVRAKTADGLKSDLSNSVSCYVENEEESEETLAAPSYLNATAMSESSVSLNWENVTGATYYLVYYSKSMNSSDAKIYNEYFTTSATITGLSERTAYFFWVKASNGTLISDFSNAAYASTPQNTKATIYFVGANATGLIQDGSTYKDYKYISIGNLKQTLWHNICKSRKSLEPGTSDGPYTIESGTYILKFTKADGSSVTDSYRATKSKNRWTASNLDGQKEFSFEAGKTYTIYRKSSTSYRGSGTNTVITTIHRIDVQEGTN